MKKKEAGLYVRKEKIDPQYGSDAPWFYYFESGQALAFNYFLSKLRIIEKQYIQTDMQNWFVNYELKSRE